VDERIIAALTGIDQPLRLLSCERYAAPAVPRSTTVSTPGCDRSPREIAPTVITSPAAVNLTDLLQTNRDDYRFRHALQRAEPEALPRPSRSCPRKYRDRQPAKVRAPAHRNGSIRRSRNSGRALESATGINERSGRRPNARQQLTTWSRKFAATVEQVKTCEGYVPKALQQRPECVGWCALGIPRKADTPQWQVSRAALVQPRPRPRGPASVLPRSHHGFQPPD
jgi:hypothetical protein